MGYGLCSRLAWTARPLAGRRGCRAGAGTVRLAGFDGGGRGRLASDRLSALTSGGVHVPPSARFQVGEP